MPTKSTKSTKPEATTKPVKPAFQPAITSTYAGPSLTTTKRPKRHTLVSRAFTNYTYRTDTALRDIVAKYGTKPFTDTGLDKAVREYLAHAGFISAPSADKLVVTKTGAAFVSKCPALTPGDKMPVQSLGDYS